MSEITLSTIEAAAYIGVGRKTLLKYCRLRHITHMIYPGGEFRFRESVLEDFMERCTIRGKEDASRLKADSRLKLVG